MVRCANVMVFFDQEDLSEGFKCDECGRPVTAADCKKLRPVDAKRPDVALIAGIMHQEAFGLQRALAHFLLHVPPQNFPVTDSHLLLDLVEELDAVLSFAQDDPASPRSVASSSIGKSLGIASGADLRYVTFTLHDVLQDAGSSAARTRKRSTMKHLKDGKLEVNRVLFDVPTLLRSAAHLLERHFDATNGQIIAPDGPLETFSREIRTCRPVYKQGDLGATFDELGLPRSTHWAPAGAHKDDQHEYRLVTEIVEDGPIDRYNKLVAESERIRPLDIVFVLEHGEPIDVTEYHIVVKPSRRKVRMLEDVVLQRRRLPNLGCSSVRSSDQQN